MELVIFAVLFVLVGFLVISYSFVFAVETQKFVNRGEKRKDVILKKLRS